MSALVTNRQHPRLLLTVAGSVIMRAAQEDGIHSIDAAYVNAG